MKESHNYIEGFHVSRIRKFFRDSLTISTNQLQSNLRISQEWANRIIYKLQELNYINKQSDNNNTDEDLFDSMFGVTEQGINFGLAHIKAIKREYAEQLFSKFLNRVMIINKNPAYLFSVNRLELFGSFIQEINLINHIDIVVSIMPKDNINHSEFYDEINALKNSFKFLKGRSASINLFNADIDLPFEINEWIEIDAFGKLISHNKKTLLPYLNYNSKIFLSENGKKSIGNFILTDKELKMPKKEISKKIVEYENMVNMHGLILKTFFSFLKVTYPGKVFCESNKENSRYRADIVRETEDKKLILYEIKTYPSALTSIRIALGQLFEYAFYPTQNLSNQFFIVSHVPATKEALLYLEHIGKKFELSINYIHFNINTNEIEPNCSA